MSSKKRLARTPEYEIDVDRAVYICYPCHHDFSTQEGLLMHKKYFCPTYARTTSLRPLPTSCTVTTSMLSDVASSDGELAPLGNSTTQSFGGTLAAFTSEAELDAEMDTSPDLAFDAHVADLSHERSYCGILETAAEGKFPARCAKRKMQSSEQESDMDCRPSSPRREHYTASASPVYDKGIEAKLKELKSNLREVLNI